MRKILLILPTIEYPDNFKSMTVQQTPQVMGIINANNESFFSSSRFTAAEEIGREISNMISFGASIIDIGACSTRPGSTPNAGAGVGLPACGSGCCGEEIYGSRFTLRGAGKVLN